MKYLPQMTGESHRRVLFVAIDRVSRWVFIRIYNSKTAANAGPSPGGSYATWSAPARCGFRRYSRITEEAFTERLFGLCKRAATSAHEFDRLGAALDIEHRLTAPKAPQTNAVVERFNARIEAVLKSHHFRSGEEREATLQRYVWLYKEQLPQSVLGSTTPLQTMQDWDKRKPELFRKQPHYLPGYDT